MRPTELSDTNPHPLQAALDASLEAQMNFLRPEEHHRVHVQAADALRLAIDTLAAHQRLAGKIQLEVQAIRETMRDREQNHAAERAKQDAIIAQQAAKIRNLEAQCRRYQPSSGPFP